ncbi:MAG TPA: dienelactone hydrolase [Burkholderiales bacterium]|nr:dienelactone hydrolase [Burkholderiales bacterium]
MRLLALLLLAWSAAAAGTIVEETVELQATVRDQKGRDHTLPFKVTVFRDDARSRSPFMVLNHGRSAYAAERAKMGRARYTDNSRYFVGKGFAVFVPTRIGYGVSGGPDIEYTGNCKTRNYPPGYEASMRQSLAVIEYARARPYVDASRGLAVGQSFGGTTAIALAAQKVPGLVGTVNFAGGGGGNPRTQPERPCFPERLAELFASYGKTARIPTLWVYAENDRYFGPKLPRQWFDAYRAAGGTGEFVLLPKLDPALGDDGHGSFTRAPSSWQPHFEAFLKKTGF